MLTAYYEITTYCPCHCDHCHVPPALRHETPIERSFTDIVIDLLTLKERLNVQNITLSGGEPTLHPKFLEIIEFARKLFKRVAVITNAVNLRALKKITDDTEVWVSLDFYGEAQDSYRKRKGLWRNYTKIADKVNVRSTLLYNNLPHITKLIENAHRKITIVPYKGSNPQLTPTPQQLQKLLLFIFKNNYAEKAVVDDPCVTHFLNLKAGSPASAPLCAACNTVIKVDVNGKIYPCPFLYSPITDITDPEANEKIASARRDIAETFKGKCINCKYKTQCGGCKASTEDYCFLNGF